MKIRFKYGDAVISIPRSASAALACAPREMLAVLISLAADPGITPSHRAEVLALTEEQISDAVAYWSDLGIIETDSPRSRATKKKREAVDNNTPHLSTLELASAAGRDDTAWLLEYCQQKMGRVFNAAEAERVVGICDYLGVTTDFVALLCDTLKKDGKLSVRSLEKLAIELHDRDVTDFGALLGYLDTREKTRALEGRVRTLFGLGSRTFTAAEKKLLEKWATAELGDGMTEFAYELTVNATGNASLKYAGAIIDKWIADGVKTLDEAKAREDKFRENGKKPAAQRKKADNTPALTSFETDDFFEKALRRSYGDEFYESVWQEDKHGDGK